MDNGSAINLLDNVRLMQIEVLHALLAPNFARATENT